MAFWNPYAVDTKIEFLFTPAGIEHYFDKVNSILTSNTTHMSAELIAAASEFGLELYGTPDWKDIGCGKNLSSASFARAGNNRTFLLELIVTVSSYFFMKH